jgi:hypothetical protein
MSSSSFLPLSFRLFLEEKNSVYASLKEPMRFALAKVFYGALANQQPHKLGDDDLFTLFWERKQRLFGNARAFDEANGVLKWFDVAIKERKGSHARGYQLTNEARLLGESYLKQSELAPGKRLS